MQVNAFTVAAGNPCDAFKEPVLNVLSRSGDDWVRREAFNAAVACNARYKALQIEADRIDEGKPYNGTWRLIDGCLNAGSYGTSYKPPSAQQMAGIRDRWKTFLKRHEKELRGKTVFKPGGMELDPDLFPGVTFRLPDGSEWPKP